MDGGSQSPLPLVACRRAQPCPSGGCPLVVDMSVVIARQHSPNKAILGLMSAVGSPADYDSDVPRYRDKEAMVAFGRAVHVERSRKRLSQAELAKLASPHLEASRLGAIERGDTDPGLTVIVRLASALGMEAWELLKAMDEERGR